MNIKHLESFLAIVQCGTITAAAKKLNVTQPLLSSQMKLLEDDLGVTLFRRGARGIHLTEAGRLFYRRARSIVDTAEAALQELEDLKFGTAGVIRLGLISSCGTGILAGPVKNFRRLFPDVRFEINEGNTIELCGRLSDGAIDMAIVRTPFRAEDFVCAYFKEDPMVAVGSPCFFKNPQKGVVTIDELSGVPIILYRRWEPLIRIAFQKRDVPVLEFCLNDDARTSFMWASAGLGVALVPNSVCSAMAGTDLVSKRLDDKDLCSRMALIYPQKTSPTPLMKSFINSFSDF